MGKPTKIRMSKSAKHNKQLLKGSPGSPGIAIGRCSLYQRQRPSVSDKLLDDSQTDHHLKCFREAREEAEQELEMMLENQADDSVNDLIRTQIEMLNDPELSDQVEREIIENNKPADSAIQDVFESYLQVIRQNHDEGLDRSVDIADVRDRLIQILHDHTDDIVEGTILVARELSPREVIEFSTRNIKGIIMDSGGTTSHAAIIARSMNIPTVVGLKNATDVIGDEQRVILDGSNGEVLVSPNEEMLEKYRQLKDQQVAAEANFEDICKRPNKTIDGHSFSLKANLEFIEELSTVQKYGAEGIGLLRTESIYLSRQNFRDQDHQQRFYESILEITEPRPVTIRLFDTGGDKFFEEGDREQNPFLGWRGIRMLLDERDLLRSQLTAILSAAAKYRGRVRILIPMISTLDELLEVREIMESIQEELEDEGINTDPKIQLGIMVEVPSVAIQADLFARHADFLSIGTNDLTQYVMAVDRGNERISKLYDQRHPAMWKMINKVAEAAEKENISVSVCGELASNPIAACCLVGLGIKNLSMNAVVLPTVKQMLRAHSFTDMQQLGQKVLESDTLDEINQLFSNWKEKTNK